MSYADTEAKDVCLSVCHTPAFCLNGYTYLRSFFTIR